MKKMLWLLLGLWLCSPFWAADKKLDSILANSAAYCEKLKQAVFHFVCLERVEESYKDKNTYISDYRILKIGNRIEEQRTLIEHNGLKVSGEQMKLRTKIYSYKASLTPIYLLAAENQRHYDYRLMDSGRVMNRKAYGIEVKIKGNDGKGSILAVVWVDAQDFSILKFNVFPKALAGFKQLYEDAKKKGMRLEIEDKHYFGVKRGDIRFPSRTEITMKFYPRSRQTFFLLRGRPQYGVPKREKIYTEFRYEDYHFFQVDVGQPVFEDVK